MKVVIDTNVLVSSFLSPKGSPAAIVQMTMNGTLRICYDMRILNEYEGVWNRPKFLISHTLSAQFLNHVRATGELITNSQALITLSDASDRSFLEVALTAHAACLITGNLKHFPPACRRGMPVLSPAEFLAFYRDEPRRASGKVLSPSEEYGVCRHAMNIMNKKISPRHARPQSFKQFKRAIDGTLSAGDVNWTPEEVGKVIRSIRKGKAVRKN